MLVQKLVLQLESSMEVCRIIHVTSTELQNVKKDHIIVAYCLVSFRSQLGLLILTVCNQGEMHCAKLHQRDIL